MWAGCPQWIVDLKEVILLYFMCCDVAFTGGGPMKRLCNPVLLLVVSIAVLSALTGCGLFVAEGRVDVTSWEQDYYEFSQEYGMVWVYFEVTNTGSIDIDYYKVWFEVRCADGSRFQDWTNGLGVSPGHYVSDRTLIDVAGKQAVAVEITGFEVDNWDY